MSDENLDYGTIRRNIEKRVRRQKRLYRLIFFWMHLILFLVTMFVVWGTVMVNSQVREVLFNTTLAAALVVVLPTILWAVALLCHVAYLFAVSGIGEKQMREQLLMREIGQDIFRKGLINEGMLEKPKRRSADLEAERALLSDDGELIPADEDEQPEQRRSNIRANNISDSD